MKQILLVLSFIISLSTWGEVFDKGKWRPLDRERGQISCPLYKNRLTVSLQRLNEYDYAEKIKKKNFKLKDYEHLISLYQRHEVPFLDNETLFFEDAIALSREQVDFIKRARDFKINSPFFRFETDRLSFPSSAFLFELDEENLVLKISMPLNYFQACLNAFELSILISNGSEKIAFSLWLDKYSHDLKHLNHL